MDSAVNYVNEKPPAREENHTNRNLQLAEQNNMEDPLGQEATGFRWLHCIFGQLLISDVKISTNVGLRFWSSNAKRHQVEVVSSEKQQMLPPPY